MQRTQWLLAFALALPMGALFLRSGGRHDHGHSGSAPASSAAKVLVTVNGHDITTADLDARVKSETHGMAVPEERRRAMLDGLVTQELMAQRARELGIDADPRYSEEAAEADAQIAGFKRRRLADLYIEREVVSKTETTDAEARKFFDENGPRARTELHLIQIFRRNRAAIDAAQAALASGKKFEEVAGGGMEGVPPGRRAPWDIGYTKWLQLPETLREAAFAMKPGEVSGILAGPNDRFWIVKLVERREDSAATFETLRMPITDFLRQTKIEARRAQVEKELHDRAQITHVAPIK
jgi:parvulin-like peptidyl-prolyl isomerase